MQTIIIIGAIWLALAVVGAYLNYKFWTTMPEPEPLNVCGECPYTEDWE